MTEPTTTEATDESDEELAAEPRSRPATATRAT